MPFELWWRVPLGFFPLLLPKVAFLWLPISKPKPKRLLSITTTLPLTSSLRLSSSTLASSFMWIGPRLTSKLSNYPLSKLLRFQSSPSIVRRVHNCLMGSSSSPRHLTEEEEQRTIHCQNSSDDGSCDKEASTVARPSL